LRNIAESSIFPASGGGILPTNTCQQMICKEHEAT
jgi:hypothetical protein